MTRAAQLLVWLVAQCESGFGLREVARRLTVSVSLLLKALQARTESVRIKVSRSINEVQEQDR